MDRDDRTPPKADKKPPVIELPLESGLSSGEQFLYRLLPAAVVSAGIHLLIAASMFVLTIFMPVAEASPQAPTVDLAVEERTDDPRQENLTEETVTLDDDTGPLTVEDAKLDDVTIETTSLDPEPAGNPDGPLTVQTDSLLTFGADSPTAILPGADVSGPGAGMIGGGNNGLAMVNESFRGRGSSSTRDALLKTGGGNKESEAAVARGLAWLARMQLRDGTWVYDGNNKDKAASTGMGLLPFLAAGQTHKPGKENKYRENAAAAIAALLAMQRPDGSFMGSGPAQPSGMYAHAIATVALCEAFGMTGDKSLLRRPCQLAIDYIERAQGSNGSWGYKAGDEGDTSIVGWQVQALHSAKLCKDLKVNPMVMKKAMEFLDTVASKPRGSSIPCLFGYRAPGPRPSLTAVGLLCRYYLNGWGPNSLGMREGVKYLIEQHSPATNQEFDMYYYYYATQVVHFREGDEWQKTWNPKMRDMLIGKQVSKPNDPKVHGSWDPDATWIGRSCGRLGTTAMSLLTLEVYYRHLPLYSRGTGGLNELDGK